MSIDEKDSVAQTSRSKEVIDSLDEWALKPKVVASHKRDQAAGIPPRELGVTWRNLTVEAISADAAIHENFLSQFNPKNLFWRLRRKPDLRPILTESHGCVKPGEMLLVLGRPGSGCSTLLNVLANKREGYAQVSGDVHFGSMTSHEAEQYRGQIIINSEEELFFPTLKVKQTMDFATRLRASASLPDGVASKEELRVEIQDFLLESMGISHTAETKVGNEFVRGVSGGERKRVSIIECLATRGSVFCWDNSTRGLDASSALEYTKAIRALTDVLGLTSIVTLYQAGNGIYNLFDKVLILDEGKQVFYGSRQGARPFMEELGFICEDGANVADFLTGVTVPTERKVRRDLTKPFPRNATELLNEYKASPIYEQMTDEYEYPTTAMAKKRTELFCESVKLEKNHHLPQHSPLVVGFATQVYACIIRQYQIIWGDKATFFIRQISNIIQALISGSLWYNAPSDSSGLFMKNGALFFSILYQALVAMSEVTESFTGRPIVLKHKSFAFYHPSALCIAQIVADIPVILCQVTTFSLVMYFMIDFDRDAGSFFVYWLFLFSVSMCMTAMFRAIGAIFDSFNIASQLSGFILPAIVIYIGFLQRKHQMHPWLVWIFWIDPLAYAFDSLMSNQFHGKVIDCVGGNLIPTGPGYNDSSHQSCAGVDGAVPRQPFVYGDDYLAALNYNNDHLWRNFGFVWAFWCLFVAITIMATSRWRSSAERGPSLLIPREKSKSHIALSPADEERQSEDKTGSRGSAYQGSTAAENSEDGAEPTDLIKNSSVYTWKDVSYTVNTPEGERVLLDNVQGWVKPGMLGALMGSSGAGKTTLLDVLAQRKTEGTIRGSILVDGRPLPISFQRSAGYCEQLDVHEPYATVREALEFSALLRQSRETPREEKLKYVDTIIDLLELHDLADTLIGTVGNGLNVEQRKRVTIGVELVAKPSILIFLDEPTSGLDGQSAYNTVRFLRKLAAVGQAVLVTIHQPSAQLFAQFDTLLLLAKGGKTVYFGEIGKQAETVRAYFAKNGAPCPHDANPAEHMIDVVSGHLSRGKDWNQVWLASPEHAKVTEELDAIIAEAAAKPPGTLDDGYEFAMPLWEQTKLVTKRMNISLYRNIDYVNNKMILHVTSALFNGFTFWNLGSTAGDLQSRVFAIWNFIFVAPGVIAQLQPLFIARRDIFETREKKSKMYSWTAFVSGLIVSEIPYLIICGVLYFVCWYWTVGFPPESTRAGATLFVVLAYEFLYTGIGQFVAAYAPNPVFASLVNPLVVSVLVSFCGILVPYQQLQAFWRYWMYWLDPFTYLMGSMTVFTTWGTEVKCTESEFAVFDPPNGTSCAEYLDAYTQSGGFGAGTNLVNPDALEGCKVCLYRQGDDYLRTLKIADYYFGWRDAAIVVIFVMSSYALVYLMMKLRTKTSKKAQ